MPISQTTITGSVKTPANREAKITGVTFQLSDLDYEAGEIIVANPIAATVDPENGDFSVALWPNDAGMDGNTRYAMTFAFSDGSSLPGLKSVYIRASDTPKTMEDVAFETKAAAAVAPYELRVLTQAEYEALSPKAPTTAYLIRG
ncbi:phage upper tail fiber protein [Falsirhodobacter sp. 20TX0035]|uniref:phage upper tail fiber protein n=1 Tax=Falsirhodobacter sp. 20TX0035 TaxID=3022019 RepID=UPI002330B720|nr:hypothetical protein [Falsirhodobacter sp. 20TX0035]MDB6455135.1 hypothetical protein [Falsirhodobacter sp. 20TX0035]